MRKPTLPLSRLIDALLLLLLLPLMFAQIKTPFNFYDEGFALTGAQRVLGGEAPYRDFWGIYPPGQFYAIAAWFKLFGSTVLVSRVYDTLVRFLTVIAVYGIARRTASPGLARLVTVVCAVFLAAAGFYSYAVFPALCLALWAILCWLASVERQATRLRALCGVFLGLALLVRWDIGAYAALAIAAGEPVSLLRRGAGARRWLMLLKSLGWIALPALVVALAGYGTVGLRSGWSSLIEQVFLFPALKLRAQRWLAYPDLLSGFPLSNDWLRFYLPILVFTIAAAVTAWGLVRIMATRKEPVNSQTSAGIVALCVFGALCFNQALSRYDLIHVTPASIAALLAAAALYARLRGSSTTRAPAWLALALLAALCWLYFVPSVKTLRANLQAFPPWGCFSKLEKAACVYIDPTQEQAVAAIQSLTQPSDPLFVGNRRHDQVFVGDSGFYYLANRPVATRYHEIHPGVVNTLPVQQEIIGELEAQKVPTIVLAQIWESTEPNGSAQSSGVTALDEYLAQNYRRVTDLGMYRILQRR